jgi:hypothetical protein
MKKSWLLWMILPLILVACNRDNQREHDKIKFSQDVVECSYNIDVTEMHWSTYADSIFLKYKIVEKRSNEKVFWGELKPKDIEVVNDNIFIAEIRNLKNGKGNIPDNILVSLLIDRSIEPENMPKIHEAVKCFVDSLPDNTVYISFFDEKTGNSHLITHESFESFENEFVAVKGNKAIFYATLLKFGELAGESNVPINPELSRKVLNDSIKKYLVLLTDGKVNVNDRNTSNHIQIFTEFAQKIDNNQDNKNKIEIHAIRYGEKSADVDNDLSYLCRDIRKSDVKGGFYTAEPEGVLNRLKEITDKMAADYELVLVNKSSGRIYAGEKREFMTQIEKEKDDKKAMGIKEYVIGTPANPVITASESVHLRVFFGIFWGIILIFLAFFFIQVIIPYLMFKTSDFDKKYVVKYKLDDEEGLEKCSYCLDDLVEDDEVVVKCQHKIHKHCWEENGHKCTEYGQSCKDGKQYYFDEKQPFSSVNTPYFMRWALFGLGGGLASWIIYQFIISYNSLVFGLLAKSLLNVFYSGNPKDLEVADYLLAFISKIGPLLIVGLLLGFVLTALFSYVNEYRKKSFQVYSEMFIRGLVGSLAGFLSFLIGSIIIIACKANGNNVWIDWIPWMLFGGSLGLCLSVRTTIAWKHALLGGVISGLLSFIILLAARWFGSYAVLFSFMLYSAGLGISIVTVHHTAQKYFLKYKGAKEGEIAIHKWMSASGGNNDVTIGKSNQCIIQMNWDNNDTIQNVHAKLFIDKKVKMPYLKVLEDNLFLNGNTVRKNSEIPLKNGLAFKIGDTEFQYVEKV